MISTTKHPYYRRARTRLSQAFRRQNPRIHSPQDAELLPYTFEPLRGADKIRILKLYPTPGQIIECSIQQISITERGYQALSYVWGSEEKPFHALVRDEDGQALGYLPLTSNLNDALHDLEYTCGLTSRVFWIDQICINQEGEEKNHQVALMGQIYKNATSVITYLGPASANKKEEKRGLRLLCRLDKHFAANHGKMHSTTSLYDALERDWEFPVTNLPRDLEQYRQEKYQKEWNWLMGLSFGEWTTRLWMVQEQLLNDTALMLRGPQLLRWEAVAFMALLFVVDLLPRSALRQYWREKRLSLAETVNSLWAVADSVFLLWKARYEMTRPHVPFEASSSVSQTLIRNMLFYGVLSCRDPRDRIFALLAISSDAADLAIIPDYSHTNTVRQCSIYASIRILYTCSELDVYLSLVCGWHNFPEADHPSWALDISRFGNMEAYSAAWNTSRAHPRQSVFGFRVFRLNMSILILKGSVVDRISISTPPNLNNRSMRLGIRDAHWVRGKIALLSNLSTILLDSGITLETAVSLSRAMITSQSWSPDPTEMRSVAEEVTYRLWCFLRIILLEIKQASGPLRLDTTGIMELIQPIIAGMAPLVLKGNMTSRFHPSDDLGPADREQCLHFQGRLVSTGRSFCATEKGHICNAQNEVREGDAVAALQGAKKLYILRPVGDRYRLIGDAYVDGLMLGEAYDGVDPDDVDYDIELI